MTRGGERVRRRGLCRRVPRIALDAWLVEILCCQRFAPGRGHPRVAGRERRRVEEVPWRVRARRGALEGGRRTPGQDARAGTSYVRSVGRAAHARRRRASSKARWPKVSDTCPSLAGRRAIAPAGRESIATGRDALRDASPWTERSSGKRPSGALECLGLICGMRFRRSVGAVARTRRCPRARGEAPRPVATVLGPAGAAPPSGRSATRRLRRRSVGGRIQRTRWRARHDRTRT